MMSRSRKKNPFVGNINSVSEKKNKQSASRLLRRKVKEIANLSFLKGFDPFSEDCYDVEMPDLKEVSDATMFSKQGKFMSEEDKDYRK